MIQFFNNRKQLTNIFGKTDEYIVLFRAEKSNTQFNYNYVRKAILQENTNIANGDILTINGMSYFVVGKHRNEAKLFQTNTTVDVVKLISEYNAAGTKTGDTEQEVYLAKPTVQWDISGNMKVYDAGLLSTTVKKFLFPICDIQLLYRIKLNGKNYKVDAINDSKYPNMYEIQVSQDTRVTK